MKKFAFSLFLFFIFSSSAFAEECDFNKASESVVKIYTPAPQEGWGTGTLVSFHGEPALLTASHVIKPGTSKITIIKNQKGIEFSVKEVFRSSRDILILDISEQEIKNFFPFLNLDSQGLKVGLQIGSFGFPFGGDMTSKRGRVEAEIWESGSRDDFYISADINQGDSGSPVLICRDGKIFVSGIVFGYPVGRTNDGTLIKFKNVGSVVSLHSLAGENLVKK